jgi:CMP-N,N'-diacetyllegionaminic acid synthase
MIHYTNEILAIIPARSGSKSIPNKNILDFAGKPLIAHSIEQAKACSMVTRIIVSTDSEEYAQIARWYGAETPFLRPREIAGDTATDFEMFKHALEWLVEHEKKVPSICVHLRPTYPFRKSTEIARAIELLHSQPEWDSLRSVVVSPETPFKMWFIDKSGELNPIVKSEIIEAHSQPRQLLPIVYLQNACIDVIRSKTIIELGSIAGNRIGSMIMNHSHDIDTLEQFDAAELAFQKQKKNK